MDRKKMGFRECRPPRVVSYTIIYDKSPNNCPRYAQEKRKSNENRKRIGKGPLLRALRAALGAHHWGPASTHACCEPAPEHPSNHAWLAWLAWLARLTALGDSETLGEQASAPSDPRALMHGACAYICYHNTVVDLRNILY